MTTTLTHFAHETETHRQALLRASAEGYRIDKAQDPIEGYREGITPQQAAAVAAEDPSLILLRCWTCSGCGDRTAAPAWHDGQPFCEGCEAAPAEGEADQEDTMHRFTSDAASLAAHVVRVLAEDPHAAGPFLERASVGGSRRGGGDVTPFAVRLTTVGPSRTALIRAVARLTGCRAGDAAGRIESGVLGAYSSQEEARGVLRAIESVGAAGKIELEEQSYYGLLFKLLVTHAREPVSARAEAIEQGSNYRLRGLYRGGMRLGTGANGPVVAWGCGCCYPDPAADPEAAQDAARRINFAMRGLVPTAVRRY